MILNTPRIDDSNVAQWMERFMEARTTVEEERALIAYFRRSDLPEDMRPYREMMQWYASLNGEAVCPPRRKSPAWRTVVAAAAVMLCVLTAGVMTWRYSEQRREMYAGSYVIRDGRVITDLNVVLSECDRAERLMSANTVDLEEIFAEEEEAMWQNIDDPEMRDFVKASLR
ncbi:MAG: DUF1616 domain-containing protein [Duncaniella sp.]|nr:DUF1616 domain-containing protein [Duncaniella sp.]